MLPRLRYPFIKAYEYHSLQIERQIGYCLGSGALPEGIYLFAGGVEDFLEALEKD
jgi:hypothetical protein